MLRTPAEAKLPRQDDAILVMPQIRSSTRRRGNKLPPTTPLTSLTFIIYDVARPNKGNLVSRLHRHVRYRYVLLTVTYTNFKFQPHQTGKTSSAISDTSFSARRRLQKKNLLKENLAPEISRGSLRLGHQLKRNR